MTLLVAVVLCNAVPTLCHGYFGHPWVGAGTFEDFYGSGLMHRFPASYSSGHDDHYYSSYLQEPCPRYHALQHSGWKITEGQQIALQVLLPGVRSKHMHASLVSDSSSVHIQGFRALPPQGRACLPAQAKTTRDGRYEIIEATIPVPAIGNVHQASVKQFRGGLSISMPQHIQDHQPSVHEQTRRSYNHQREGHVEATRPAQMIPPSKLESSGTQSRKPSQQTRVASHSRVTIPPSTGVVVEDDDFPWPEKNLAASEGWLDNRGEFQPY